MSKSWIINLAKVSLVGGILYYLVTSIASYEVTSLSIERLQQAAVPQEIITSIQQVPQQPYSSEEEFLAALGEQLNPEQLSQYQALLLKHTGQPRLNFDRLQLLLDQPLMLAGLILLIGLWVIPLAAVRWWLLLKAVGLDVKVLRAYMLTWIGNFFNTTLPGAVSGDVVKGYYIIRAQENEGKTRAFTTLLIDRFVGLFGLIVMAFVALLINPDFAFSQEALQPLAMMIIGLFIGTVVFYTIVIFPFSEGKDPFIRLLGIMPGKQTWIKIYTAFKLFQEQKKTLVATLLLSIMIHLSIAFMFFQIASLMGIQHLDVQQQLFIMPIGLIAIAIPVAPGGVGVGHAAFASLYLMVGVHGGADIFNLYVIVQLSVFLLGGIPYFFYKNEYKLPQSSELAIPNKVD